MAIFASVVSGCASVKVEPKDVADKAKKFDAPAPGNAGLYVYRNSMGGRSLKKDIWIDGQCLGESARNVFFYTQLAGGKTHKIETESEMSPNALEIFTEAGKNYFVRQYIKLGVLVGGADLEQVEESKAKTDLAKLRLATPGNCEKQTN